MDQDIAGIWKDVLHIEQIESDQTFFDLGGPGAPNSGLHYFCGHSS